MSASDEQGYSLADQAAAWVPPWLREQPVEVVEAPPGPELPAAADPATDPVRLRAEGPHPSAVAEETDIREKAAAEPSPPAPLEPATVVPHQADSSSFPTVVAPVARTEPVSAALPMLALVDDDELRAALEAILLVVDQPVTAALLASALEQPVDRVTAMLKRLADDYIATRRGFELRRAAGGWRLYTRPEYAAYVERFVLDGQSVRLTQAALETLAVVAYKQPVTRSRISAIRGVSCDGVIRTLVSRGLIEECGTEPESGAYLYRTTPLFLEKLGLDRVEQLPPLAPFLPDNLEEIADVPR